MARHYDPIDRPDGGLCRDRAPVNCEGVPTLPDVILNRIRNKEEPTPEEQELAKPALAAAMAELRKRINAEAAKKSTTKLGAGRYRYRGTAHAARSEIRQMVGDYASLASEEAC